jgi:hypothetical protein
MPPTDSPEIDVDEFYDDDFTLDAAALAVLDRIESSSFVASSTSQFQSPAASAESLEQVAAHGTPAHVVAASASSESSTGSRRMEADRRRAERRAEIALNQEAALRKAQEVPRGRGRPPLPQEERERRAQDRRETAVEERAQIRVAREAEENRKRLREEEASVVAQKKFREECEEIALVSFQKFASEVCWLLD